MAAERLLLDLCRALLPLDAVDLDPAGSAAVTASVSDFVAGQLRLIPLPAKLVFHSGLLLFRFWVWLQYRRPFSSLAEAERRAAVAAWAWGRVSLARQVFRPLRSTAFLAFFEAPEVRSALECSAGSPEAGP